MKKAFLAILILSAVSMFAQSNTFSFALTPISLPGNHQTVAGTAAGMTFSPTPNFDLREDTIFAPGQNFQFYGGGFNYRLPILSTKLNNMSPNLSGSRFQFYLTASAGIDRITGADTQQHYAFLAGGGVNYDVTASGTWTMGAEVRYAKFPGLNNNTVVVGLGPAVHF